MQRCPQAPAPMTHWSSWLALPLFLRPGLTHVLPLGLVCALSPAAHSALPVQPDADLLPARGGAREPVRILEGWLLGAVHGRWAWVLVGFHTETSGGTPRSSGPQHPAHRVGGSVLCNST